MFLLCAAYLLAWGILVITSDNNNTEEITNLSIASVITGAVGILYTMTDTILCVLAFGA